MPKKDASEVLDRVMAEEVERSKKVRIQAGTIIADELHKLGIIQSDERPGFVKAVEIMTDDEAGQFTDRLSEELGL